MKLTHIQRGVQEIQVTFIIEYTGPYTLEDRVLDGIVKDVRKAIEEIEKTWRLVRFNND